MLRSCARRSAFPVSVTKVAGQTRRYANNNKSILHDIAEHITTEPSTTASTSSAPGPPVRAQPRSVFNTERATSSIPEGFIPFQLNSPYNPYDFEPKNRVRSTSRTFFDPAGPPRAIAIREDVFHQLELNPLDEVLNCGLITSFTTPMGRIKKRNETRLTWKSQKRIGKAVRRAQAMGLIPKYSQWDKSMIRN
ncbi:hypothetical protein FRC14_007149 [Serendipita sp. 396]|nr:hypothetical protein FRC14_007149 [Serendipita sp. 396]KAG8786694.1 hypothetical protein FRC15_010915 [Serendipita sp. 397]KAG8825703.1 hypothetical protein FRC19_010693 [Serendipita sp. 401]KAG8857904.1 hypothetical protein FRB91_010672 [Serendipita sp. 411]KAG9056278.1 hypothetical protein FS842_011167 [Serendipita sp. 407]